MRGEVTCRSGWLSSRCLRESAVVQEGSEPPESPGELLAEVDRLADELERLIGVINQINSSTQLSSVSTGTELCARIRSGKVRQLRLVCGSGGGPEARSLNRA